MRSRETSRKGASGRPAESGRVAVAMRDRKDRSRPPRVAGPAAVLLLRRFCCCLSAAAPRALIYEMVWFQLIQLVIGATAVSLGVLLATFMGGLCAGSLLAPRLIAADRILCGSTRISSWASPCAASWYCSVLPVLGAHRRSARRAGLRRNAAAWRSCAASLPAAPDDAHGRHASRGRRVGWTTPAKASSWLGFFYGGNIAGAVRRRARSASTCCACTTW